MSKRCALPRHRDVDRGADRGRVAMREPDRDGRGPVAQVGRAVGEAVGAELLDQVDPDRDAVVLADQLPSLGADADRDPGAAAATPVNETRWVPR